MDLFDMSFRTGSDAGDAINTRQTRLLHQRCTGKKHGNDADPRPTLRNGAAILILGLKTYRVWARACEWAESRDEFQA